MIDESVGQRENQYVFQCDSCVAVSREYFGAPDYMTREHAVERVKSRGWKGQGEQWTVCRLSSLEVRQLPGGCVLLVPFDLSENLANYFVELDLDCELKRLDNADQNTLWFPQQISPAQIETALKKWNGWPLLPQQRSESK